MFEKPLRIADGKEKSSSCSQLYEDFIVFRKKK
jgi:hypothetical protein